MQMWKQILIVIFVGGLAYAGYQHIKEGDQASDGAKSFGSSEAALVEVASTEKRQIKEIIEAVGTTRAVQSIEIVPEAMGRIEEIAFAPGQLVEKGAVLIRLDNAIARADVAEAEARLIERDSVQKRAVKLRDNNAVAQAAIEESVARLAEAQAELDRARQRLSERVIRAPFAGTVGLSEVDLGARVDTDTIITRLDDLSKVEVEFALPETRFAQIKPGQKISGVSAAFGETRFDGEIDAVDSRVDPVSRSFRVRALIPNPTGTLPSGMFMSLELVLSEAEHITIPEESLLFQGQDTYVYRVIDGKAQRSIVQVGKRQDGFVAILDGLGAGDQVVVRGLHRLQEGRAVEILDPTDAQAGDAKEIKS